MAEVADAREHQGDPPLVGCGDDLFVATRPSRFNDRRDTGIGEDVESNIAEYKRRSPVWNVDKLSRPVRIHTNPHDEDVNIIEVEHLIQALKAGTPPDMDVYDAAAWSCITELSEKSVADRSKSMDFPDFTRGNWKDTAPLGIVS